MDFIFRRPAIIFCLSLLGSIVAASYGDFLLIAACLLLLSAFFIIFSYGNLKGRLPIFVLMIIFYITGATEFSYLDRNYSSKFEPYAGQVVTVTGFVASEPDIKNSKVSYVIKVQSIDNGSISKKTDGKLLLSTMTGSGFSFFDYGTKLEMTARLDLPKGVRNPGGFDYKRYLSQKGVSGTMFSTYDGIKRVGFEKTNLIFEIGRTIRQRITGVIEKSLPRQQAGLLEGMLIGYRDNLPEEVQTAFSDAGLTHIMAVSGANVAFLVLPLTFLFKKLRLGRVLSYSLIIAFLALFVVITGFEPSVLRAVIMAVFILIGNIAMRETDVFTSIALSAILILLFSPYMLFNAGFVLSYAATLSLVLLSRNIKKLIQCRFIPGKLADVIAVTLAAQVGVIPVVLLCFNRISLVSLLSNLLVVPLLEIVTILGMLMAILGQISIFLSQLLGFINFVFLSFILLVTKVTAGLTFSTIKLPTPSIPAVILYYGAVLYFLWYLPVKQKMPDIRLLSAGAAALAAVMVFSLLAPSELNVTFLDVGEGDSAFIRTSSGKTVLIDGGGSTNPNNISSIGESTILPFLLDSGVTRLDLVIATHGHADHIQGLKPVMEQMQVGGLIIPSSENAADFKSLTGIAGPKGIKVSACSDGDRIRLDDGTELDVLFPFGGSAGDYSSLNNDSLVLKLHYGLVSILFTGDAQKEAEQELLEKGEALDADVIKVAHHGSNTSTSGPFIEAIKPKAAIISVGRNNFGHPSGETLKLLEDRGVQLFRTDECGAVYLSSDGRKIKIKTTVVN